MSDMTQHEFLTTHEEYFNRDQGTAGNIKKRTVYEQPLNERIRTWLRLEYLFLCAHYHAKGLASWESKAAVDALIELIEFIARTDLKPDLIKDLERRMQQLVPWKEAPGVDTKRLDSILKKLSELLAELANIEGSLAQCLLDTPFLSTIRQRHAIPGGSCRFDLPNYYHWLQRPAKQRQIDLNDWLNTLSPLQESINAILYLVRHHGQRSQEIAQEGFYQAKLDSSPETQLIRVVLHGEQTSYPEISGGKHRFTLRFFEYTDSQEAPVAFKQDIGFDLYRCS